ncbi:MAG: PH domain-containing protein [archaeon]|nr:PH domain-containing protein [archaeon]
MAFLQKLAGHAEVGADLDVVEDYLFENEEVIQSFQFLRDSIVLTNLGIYTIDVQGLTGKKVEVKFFPKKAIKTISYESAGTMDLDVDIKIGVDHNPIILTNGGSMDVPISFKVPSSQADEAKQIVLLVKAHYLCSD